MSVLGPLLFVLYINDLPDNIKSFTKLFADDLKMIAKESDKLQVNNDLKMLELWESTWLLEFNVKKCKVLHTSFNNNPHNALFERFIQLVKHVKIAINISITGAFR